MIANSLRCRIQIWHAVSLAAVVIGLLAAFYRYEKRERYARIDARLQQIVILALPALTPPIRFPEDDGLRGGPPRPGGRPRPKPLHEAKLDEARSEFRGLYYALVGLDGRVEVASPGVSPNLSMPTVRVRPEGNVFRTRDGNRELLHGVPRGRVIVLGLPVAEIESGLRRLAWRLWGIGAAIFLLAWCGGWWLAGRALRPIDAITAAARRIAGGRLSERIAVANPHDELGRLSGVLNDTFAQLEGDFDRQARFTSNASHELRTPVSVLLSQAQLALMRDRTPEEYREALSVCGRTAQRMRELIDGMLELAAIDSGEHDFQFAPHDLAEVARDAVQNLGPLAEGAGIALRPVLAPTPCRCDARAMSQVVTNLVANAIKHHRPEGEPPRSVNVTTFSDERRVGLRVADDGPGIAPEDLPHIFDRFYRGDKARTRRNGSTGLGLSIGRAIVEAHGGTLSVASAPGEGARFEVSLPREKSFSD